MSLTSIAPSTPSTARAPLRPPALEPTPPAPMPLPTGSWGAADALAALEEARTLLVPTRPVGLLSPLPPVAPVRVVSALTTVVLHTGEYAVKVYPPGTDIGHLDRLAGALAGSTTAHLPLFPAVATPYGVVTVSAWLPPARPVSWKELGLLLRRFHDEHASADVPVWAPLSRLPRLAAGLPEDWAGVLLRARGGLLDALGEVGSEAGEGPIHGDVSPSNVLRTAEGPRLIDLDWVAWGPREYDLASAARRARSGEISRRTYAAFCSAYGFDVRRWPGLPVLDRIAELGALAFRVWDSRHHHRDLDWVETELRAWRTAL